MVAVVDAYHDDVRDKGCQCYTDIVEVGQLSWLLVAADIGQRQLHPSARGNMLEGTAIAVTGITQADNQDLHTEASCRISRRSSLISKPKAW